jgi:tetratricopeptide (TPR) repeat protein
MHCSFEGMTLPRRLAVAFVALACAGVLFRGQIASGLVSRGDEFAQSGEPARALVYYQRALRLDAASDAAERYAFTSLMLKQSATLSTAVAVASAALERKPQEEALLVDRALCLNALGEYSAARRDFELIAQRTGDPRYYEFAAQAARRAGERARAARLFAHVIALAPRFVAARRALANLRTER